MLHIFEGNRAFRFPFEIGFNSKWLSKSREVYFLLKWQKLTLDSSRQDSIHRLKTSKVWIQIQAGRPFEIREERCHLSLIIESSCPSCVALFICLQLNACIQSLRCLWTRAMHTKPTDFKRLGSQFLLFHTKASLFTSAKANLPFGAQPALYSFRPIISLSRCGTFRVHEVLSKSLANCCLSTHKLVLRYLHRQACS